MQIQVLPVYTCAKCRWGAYPAAECSNRQSVQVDLSCREGESLGACTNLRMFSTIIWYVVFSGISLDDVMLVIFHGMGLRVPPKGRVIPRLSMDRYNGYVPVICSGPYIYTTDLLHLRKGRPVCLQLPADILHVKSPLNCS